MAHETLVDLLARAMAEEDLNMTAAAARVGVSRQAFSLWMKGAYQPKLDLETLEGLIRLTGEDHVTLLKAAGLLPNDVSVTTGDGNAPYRIFATAEELVA